MNSLCFYKLFIFYVCLQNYYGVELIDDNLSGQIDEDLQKHSKKVYESYGEALKDVDYNKKNLQQYLTNSANNIKRYILKNYYFIGQNMIKNININSFNVEDFKNKVPDIIAVILRCIRNDLSNVFIEIMSKTFINTRKFDTTLIKKQFDDIKKNDSHNIKNHEIYKDIYHIIQINASSIRDFIILFINNLTTMIKKINLDQCSFSINTFVQNVFYNMFKFIDVVHYGLVCQQLTITKKYKDFKITIHNKYSYTFNGQISDLFNKYLNYVISKEIIAIIINDLINDLLSVENKQRFDFYSYLDRSNEDVPEDVTSSEFMCYIEKRYTSSQDRYTPDPEPERYTSSQDRYTSSQDRYTSPQDRYTPEPENYTSPQDRYTSSQDRYTPEPKICTIALDSAPKRYTSAPAELNGDYTLDSSDISENELHVQKIDQPIQYNADAKLLTTIKPNNDQLGNNESLFNILNKNSWNRETCKQEVIPKGFLLKRTIKEKDRYIKTLNNQNFKHRQCIKNQQDMISDKEQQLKGAKTTLNNSNKKVKEQEKIIIDKEASIVAQSDTIKKQSKEMDKQKQKITELETALHYQKNEINNMNKKEETRKLQEEIEKTKENIQHMNEQFIMNTYKYKHTETEAISELSKEDNEDSSSSLKFDARDDSNLINSSNIIKSNEFNNDSNIDSHKTIIGMNLLNDTND